ncbi:MAG: hypothetical protein JST70_12940 [Bacteroidetes bacterium]|nr:hypothetical protein [Bacteroidota bacterium]
MKLIAVTGIIEYRDDIAALFKKAHVPVFSEAETTGHKNMAHANLQDNWFGKVGEHFQSVLFFSFTNEEYAYQLMELVNEHNMQTELSYPIHAYIVAVERFSE